MSPQLYTMKMGLEKGFTTRRAPLPPDIDVTVNTSGSNLGIYQIQQIAIVLITHTHICNIRHSPAHGKSSICVLA